MMDPSSYWILGVTFSFASSLMSCLGLIFQKYAHTQNQNLPEDKKYPVMMGIVCSPCWWASFLLMGLLPFPFDFFAYSFAAQSLVAPFAALTLIMNQFFAPLILKEKLHRVDIYGSILVFIGTIMTTLTGNHDDATYTLDDLMMLFGQTAFIVGLVILTLIMGCMIFSICKFGPSELEGAEHHGQSKQKSPQEVEAEDATQTQVREEAVEERDVNIQPTLSGAPPSPSPSPKTAVHAISFAPSQDTSGGTDKRRCREKPFMATLKTLNLRSMPFYYGFVSGGFGATQNVFFKAVGVLMKTSVVDGGPSAWGTPYPYLFGIVTIILAVAQLSYLNMGMARFDAVLVFPLYNACYIFLAVTMGALYYQEFESFSTWQYVLFPTGICITLSGIILLCFKPGQKDASQGSEGVQEAADSRSAEERVAERPGESQVVLV